MKQKLELKKKTICVLSNDDLMRMNGADNDPAFTTSFGVCTGFACCDSDSKWERAVLAALFMATVYIAVGK